MGYEVCSREGYMDLLLIEVHMCRQSLNHIFHGLIKSPIAPKPAPSEKPAGHEEQPETQMLSPPQLARGLLSPAGPPSSKRRRVLASPSLGLGRRLLQTPVKQAETGMQTLTCTLAYTHEKKVNMPWPNTGSKPSVCWELKFSSYLTGTVKT